MIVGVIARQPTAVPGIETSFWTAIPSVPFGLHWSHGSFELGAVVVGLMGHMINSMMLGAVGVALVAMVLGSRPSIAAAARRDRMVFMSGYADMMKGNASADASVQGPFLLPRQPTEPDLVAKYFKVLSDPARVRVLESLRERGELSVGQLTAELGLRRTNLSNHLGCLRWCGFVQTRREHRTVYYRVADARVSELLALGRALLADNAEHVAACRRVEGRG